MSLQYYFGVSWEAPPPISESPCVWPYRIAPQTPHSYSSIICGSPDHHGGLSTQTEPEIPPIFLKSDSERVSRGCLQCVDHQTLPWVQLIGRQPRGLCQHLFLQTDTQHSEQAVEWGSSIDRERSHSVPIIPDTQEPCILAPQCAQPEELPLMQSHTTYLPLTLQSSLPQCTDCNTNCLG